LIGWLLYQRGRMRVQTRSEFHRQLLDKFASGGDFAVPRPAQLSPESVSGIALLALAALLAIRPLSSED
jgi:hypothetical protein